MKTEIFGFDSEFLSKIRAFVRKNCPSGFGTLTMSRRSSAEKSKIIVKVERGQIKFIRSVSNETLDDFDVEVDNAYQIEPIRKMMITR